MFRSSFEVYEKIRDLKEEDRIAILEAWKQSGVKPEVTGWWNVNAPISSAAELKEAIDDTPPGGICICSLSQDIEIVASSTTFSFENKKIYILGNGNAVNITYDTTGNLFAGSGQIVFSNVNTTITFTPAVSSDVYVFWPTSRYAGEAFSSMLLVEFTLGSLTLDDQSGSSAIKNLTASDLLINVPTIVITSSSASTVKLQNTVWPRRFHYTGTLTDEAGNALSVSDYVAGVIADANGVPRNIVSNIVL